MSFKQFFLTFIVAFLIFALLVFLGMKFEWVKAFRDDEPNTLNLPPEQAVLIQSDATKDDRPKAEVPKYELVDESMQPGTAMDMIRNDCIRASRHAGVTDADIFRVVDECVAMELRKQGGSVPSYDNADNSPNPENAANDESYQLTREACEMVAAENTTASPEEIEKQIQACITDNLDN